MAPPDILRYLPPRPPLELDFDDLAYLCDVRRMLRAADAPALLTVERVPAWKLLCYLAEQADVVLHGTGDPAITEFVPRRPTDTNPFGAQNAVYAASDGIWPMFYAILDRSGEGFSLHNGCVSFLDEDGLPMEPRYFFSIEWHALERRPFRPGYVYVLPKNSFVQDPQTEVAGLKFVVHHWASLEPVRALAIVPVAPADFPFLDAIRGHDDAVLARRMREAPHGFPWVDELSAP